MFFTGCRRLKRTEFNHALEYAILKANELHQPVVVFFGSLTDSPKPMIGITVSCSKASEM